MNDSGLEKTVAMSSGDSLERTQLTGTHGGTLMDPQGASLALRGASPALAPAAPRLRRRFLPWGVGLVAVVAIAVSVATLSSGREPPAQPAGFDLAFRTEPVEAQVELDGVFISAGVVLRTLPRDGRPHTLRVRAPGYITRTITFIDHSPGELVTLDPQPAPREPAARRTPPASGGMADARACMSTAGSTPEANRCIVNALEGRADSEPEQRLLCITYRAMADRANAVGCMQRYIARYPETRFADQFQGYINGE